MKLTFRPKLVAILVAAFHMTGALHSANADELTITKDSALVTVHLPLVFGKKIIDFHLPAPDLRYGSFNGGYVEISSATRAIYGSFPVLDARYSIFVDPRISMTFTEEWGGKALVGGYFTRDTFSRLLDEEIIEIRNNDGTIDFKYESEWVSYQNTTYSHNPSYLDTKFPIHKYQNGGDVAIFDATQIEMNGINSLGSRGYVQQVQMRYSYTFDSDEQSWLDEASLWLDNISKKGQSELIKAISPKSNHIRKSERGVGGLRGSYTPFVGQDIYTSSPGMLVYDITLPDAASLDLPIMFIENNLDARIEVQFNGDTLYQASGEDFTLEEMITLNLDIDAYRGLTGELSIIIDNDGGPSARIFLPESLVMDDIQVTNYAPVPEPETYAMMLAGLGLIGVIARRRKQQQASA